MPLATFQFSPTLTVSEQWSDNFLLTPTNHKQNFRTTVGPGFGLSANTQRTQASVSATLNFSFDTHDEADRRFNLFPNLSAAVIYRASPVLTLSLTDSLNSGDDASQVDQFGTRSNERRRFFTNSLGLSADWMLDAIATQAYYRQSIVLGASETGSSGGLDDSVFSHVFGVNASAPVLINNSVRVGYELSFSNDSLTGSGSTADDDRRSGSSTGHLFLASVTRRVNPFASVGVSTSYSLQTRDNSRVWNISLISSYGLPTGLSVSSSIGYSFVSSDRERGTSGLSTNTNVSYRFGQAIASLGVFQDYRQTYVQGEDLGIVQSRALTAGLSFPLTALTTTSFTASYNENEPTGDNRNDNRNNNGRFNGTTKSLSATASLASRLFTAGVRATRGENQLIGRINSPTQQSGTSLTVGAFAGVPIFSWLNMTLDYDHYIREDPAGDVVENRASVTFRASF